MEERIDIVVSERGSRVVQRNIEDIGRSSRTTAGGVNFLKQALVGIGAALSVREVARLLDTYTNLQNRLRATGLESQNLSAVYNELLGVANSTRSSLEGSVELYSRLAISTKDLGVSQRELIDFTKSLNQAILLSGASSIEAQAGLIQLSQGMASGVVRGDELRSVLEQLPTVADVIAKQLQVTRGELRTMGEEGKITTTVILDAFRTARSELEEGFGKTVPTINQSLQVLRNNLVDLTGNLDSSTGASTILSNTILGLANNLDTLAKASASVASGFLLIGGTSKTIDIATVSVRALTLAIAANPLGFLLVVVTSAITALTLFRDQISLGSDEITTLGDLIRALGEIVGPVFRKMYQLAQSTIGPLIGLFEDFFDGVNFSVIGALRIVARGVDTYVGLWSGAIDAVIVLFQGLPSAFGDLFTRALNVLLSKITGFVNGAIKLLEPLTNLASIEIKPLDFLLENDNQGAAAKLGSGIGEAFKNGFESVKFAENFLDDLTARSEAIAKSQQENKTGRFSEELDRGPEFSSAQSKQLEQLISGYDKVFAAQNEYVKGVELLEQAEAAGAITSKRKAEVLDLIHGQLRDSLDPLAAITREMELEIELLGQTAQQRELSNQVRSIEQDLLGQGVILNEQELSQLREKLALTQEEAKLSQVRADILTEFQGRQEEINTKVQAATQLLADKSLTEAQHTAVLREAVQAQRELNFELGQADFADGFLLQMETMLGAVQNFTGEAGILFADYFSTLTDGFADAAARSIVFGESFKEAMGNVARQALTQLLSGLIRLGTQFLLNAALGQSAATAATAASVAQAAAVSAAWATPAALTSLASFGANAAPAASGLASTVALSNALSLPKFAFGGDFEVAGSGGTDSQLVAFRATPGESVSIKTPTQNRDESRQGGGGESAERTTQDCKRTRSRFGRGFPEQLRRRTSIC